MISLRRKPARVWVITALPLLAAVLCALPGAAFAASEGSEESSSQLAFAPASYDFGIQRVSSYPSQTTLQLRNDSETAKQIVSLDVVGDSAAFLIYGTDCASRTLAPSETCWVGIEFSPYEAVPFAARLRAHLEGGATVTADLSGEGGRAILAPTADPTSFGSVPVGSPGVTETIEIRNDGNMAGSIFIAVISGGAVGSFHLLDEDCTGLLLSPDGACNLLIGFQPLSTGVKTARLALFADSSGSTGAVLTGVGTEAESLPGDISASSRPDDVRARARRHHRHRPRRHKRALHRRHRAGHHYHRAGHHHRAGLSPHRVSQRAHRRHRSHHRRGAQHRRHRAALAPNRVSRREHRRAGLVSNRVTR